MPRKLSGICIKYDGEDKRYIQNRINLLLYEGILWNLTKYCGVHLILQNKFLPITLAGTMSQSRKECLAIKGPMLTVMVWEIEKICGLFEMLTICHMFTPRKRLSKSGKV